MNLKLNDYINVFYRNKPDDIQLLKNTKDYKEFIDVMYNEKYDLNKLLVIYRNDIVHISEDLNRNGSELEQWLQEEINDIDDCNNFDTGIYNVYDKDKNLLGTMDNGEFIPLENNKAELLTPKQINKELNKYVKGQTEATKVISNAVSRQLLKINKSDEIKEKGLELPFSNIMLIGESGVGKTYIMEVVEKLFNIPTVVVNCATLSKSGYIGASASDCISDLVEKCNYNFDKAEKGIIVLDEIDKIASKDGIISKERDVTSEVMMELLKLIEGETVAIKGGLNGTTTIGYLNTKNILFVCCGAFTGIEEIVKKRLEKEGKLQSKSMGFGGNVSPNKLSIQELRSDITRKDLEEYGIIPELLGRIAVTCNLNPLTKEVIKEILLSENGILKEYKDMFKLYGKNLKLDDNIIDYIVNETIKDKQLGVRALRTILERILNETLYNMPSDKKKNYIINKDMLKVG